MEEKEVKVFPMLSVMFFPFLGMMGLFNTGNLWESLTYEGADYFSSVESQYAEDFLGKDTFLDLNSSFSQPLDQVELNDVVKLHNGHLTTLLGEVDPDILSLYSQHTEEFYEFLDEKEIPFAFVLSPYKLPEDDDIMLPKGYTSYANQNANILMSELAETVVPVLNLQEEMFLDDLDHYDYFFKTDHHWTVYGGFWATEKVSNLVDSLLGESHFVPEFGDLDNYDLTLYEDFWIGTHGKRTGEVFSGLDDLPVLTPSFETDIQVEMPDWPWDKRGDFSTAFLNEERLDINPYAIYLTSDLDTKITNYNADNDTTIFMIKDSFALVMAPFLSLHYKNVYLYDFRLSGYNADHMQGVLEEVQPDIVLCFYNTSVFDRDNMFRFLPWQEEVVFVD
ncbi:MAG: hypothetical protein R3Y63_05145 [Eubacteriales bacterium]